MQKREERKGNEWGEFDQTVSWWKCKRGAEVGQRMCCFSAAEKWNRNTQRNS